LDFLLIRAVWGNDIQGCFRNLKLFQVSDAFFSIVDSAYLNQAHRFFDQELQ